MTTAAPEYINARRAVRTRLRDDRYANVEVPPATGASSTVAPGPLAANSQEVAALVATTTGAPSTTSRRDELTSAQHAATLPEPAPGQTHAAGSAGPRQTTPNQQRDAGRGGQSRSQGD